MHGEVLTVLKRRQNRPVTDLKETAHGWVKEHLQVLEDLIIEQVLQLDVVALLSNSIFGLLPEFVRDVVVSEAMTVRHYHLEEVLDSELEPASFEVEGALLLRVAGEPCDPNRILVLRLLNPLCLFHLILGESITVLTN